MKTKPADVRSAEEAGPDGDGRRTDLSSRLALYVFVLAAVAAYARWLSLARTEWFQADDWDFIAGRTAFRPHDLFTDHDTHWTTVPLLVFRFMWWLFGIGSYTPYVALLVALHVTVAALLRVVMRRALVDPWIATAAASLFAFFGAGYQNIVWAFQIGFVGALAFGLVSLLLADHDGPFDRRDWLAVGAGLLALMSTGVGVTMVGVTTFAVLLRRGPRMALLYGGPLAALYVSWWMAIARHTDHPGVRTDNVSILDIMRFVRTGIGRTLRSLGQLPAVTLLLVALVVVVGATLIASHVDWATFRNRFAAPAALALGAVGFLISSGYGRVGLFGPALAEASRYQHIVAALLLPALAVTLDAVVRRWRLVLVPVCALLVVGIPANIDVLADYTRSREASNRAYRRVMLSIPYSKYAHQVPENLRPDTRNPDSADITVGWLLAGAASGRIPEPGSLTPADEAAVRLRLAFIQRKPDPAPPGACEKVDGRVKRRFQKGDAILFLGGSLRVTDARLGAGRRNAPVELVFNPANGPRLVATLGPIDAELRPRNSGAAVTICDVSS